MRKKTDHHRRRIALTEEGSEDLNLGVRHEERETHF